LDFRLLTVLTFLKNRFCYIGFSTRITSGNNACRGAVAFPDTRSAISPQALTSTSYFRSRIPFLLRSSLPAWLPFAVKPSDRFLVQSSVFTSYFGVQCSMFSVQTFILPSKFLVRCSVFNRPSN